MKKKLLLAAMMTVLTTAGPRGAAADSPLDGVVRTHLIQGGGTVVVCGGDVRTWKGPEGGAWSEPSNWTPAGVPTADDDVTISAKTSPIRSGSSASTSMMAVMMSGTAFASSTTMTGMASTRAPRSLMPASTI